ncbi:MAG: hypothetical protein AABW47_03255 [Nanoarchaeota archaeon]
MYQLTSSIECKNYNLYTKQAYSRLDSSSNNYGIQYFRFGALKGEYK